MATRVRIRVIDDNKIPSQLDEVSMKSANKLFKAALNMMVRIKTEKGVNKWQCTVYKKQYRDKTLIRKHIKRMHV